MSWLDGNKMQSTREADLVREQAERAAMKQQAADRKAAQEAAHAQAEADRIATENAELERRMRAAYPGSPEQWAVEGPAILVAERARLTAVNDAKARQQAAARYQ